LTLFSTVSCFPSALYICAQGDRADLSLANMVLTLAIFPTVLRNSKRDTPWNQSRLLSTFTPPSSPTSRSTSRSFPLADPRFSAYAMPFRKKRWTWAVIAATFFPNSSCERDFRSLDRPDGSPIEPVAPPI